MARAKLKGRIGAAEPSAEVVCSSAADAEVVRAAQSKLAEERGSKRRIRNPKVTRARLLRAAVDLVAAKGAEQLSVQEAARLANVSRGIAYHYFKERDQLLHAAMKWASQRMQEGVEQHFGASLHDRVIYSTRFVLENPDICKLTIADALAGRDFDRRAPYIKFVSKMYRQLVAKGLAPPDLNVEIATYVSFGTMATILMLREQRKGEDMSILAEQFTKEWSRVLRHGLLLDGSTKTPKTRTRLVRRTAGNAPRRK